MCVSFSSFSCSLPVHGKCEEENKKKINNNSRFEPKAKAKSKLNGKQKKMSVRVSEREKIMRFLSKHILKTILCAMSERKNVKNAKRII